MSDLEVFVHSDCVEDALAALRDTVGSLEAQGEPEDGEFYLARDLNCRISLTRNVEDGPLVSIYLNGDDLPWQSDQALAEYLHRRCGCLVRCVLPGSSHQFLEVSNGDVRVVDSL